MTESLLMGLALVLFLGIGAQWVAQKFQMPSILLLLIAGFVAGPILNVLNPDRLFGNLLFPIVSLSVGIILFEGGLSLDLKEIRDFKGIIARLLSLGVMASWLLSSLLAWYILKFPIGLSILLGAILTVTGPTVIGPMLRFIRPRGKTGAILKWEGIIIDPIGAILAVLVYEVLIHAHSVTFSFWLTLEIVFLSILVGSFVGFLMAFLLVFALYKDRVPESLENPVTLMMIISAFAISNHLQGESGLLATTIMGIVLANQKWLNIRHIIEFKETLRTLLISSIFILLAANVKPDALQKIDLSTFLFLFGIILLVRPVSIFISTIGAQLSFKEKVFLSALAPRGIVAAAMGSVFAIRLSRVYPNADLLASTVFFVIVGTIAIYGIAANPIAKLLDLSRKNPQGILIIGAHYWARKIASLLKEINVEVLLVDSNIYNVSTSKAMDLNIVHGNILDEYVVDQLELENIGNLYALTSNDEINSLAAIRFSDIFSQNNLYQLTPHLIDDTNQVTQMSKELRAHCLFSRDLNFKQISHYMQNEASIVKLPLNNKKNFDDTKKEYGQRLIPLIIKYTNGNIDTFNGTRTVDTQNAQALIAIVLPDTPV